MIFATWLYALFLLVAVAGTWALPARVRPWWVIAAGFVFYATYYAPHLPLVLVVTAGVYAGARWAVACDAPGRRRALGWLVAASVVFLGYYKYTAFALDSAASAGLLAPARGRWLVPSPVPLAISFFVFEYVHWLIELRRGSFAPGSPRDFLLFIFFFPTLICGPIKRYESFQPQLASLGRPTATDVSEGCRRLVVGLAKKLIVADTLQRLVGPAWQNPLAVPSSLLWPITYAYAFQILFDFSGYSDMAIGSARLLGVHVPENFDRPYARPTITRFWRSWHMSLTSWITDYVYIPLGGNRRGEWRAAGNRLAAMAACGLWHGAAGHFILWGVYHGLLMNVQRAWTRWRARRGLPGLGPLGRLLATLLTFHAVCLGWVLFVCDTATAWVVMRRMLGVG